MPSHSFCFCRYENKGVKWINERPACPGAEFVTPATEESKNAEKNRKKKEAKKRCAAKKSEVGDAEVSEKMGATTISEQELPTDPAEINKRLRNLNKKLAQTDALKAKIDSGEIAKPEPDQLKKVERRNELVDEIAKLESLL